MQSLNRIDFAVEFRPDLEVRELLPLVDNASLVELVQRFEENRNFDVAGGYGGLIPEFYRYGSLFDYLLGTSFKWPGNEIFLLACDCGELGCWPLKCRVSVREDIVVWDEFSQPYRPERDYREFGPFHFDVSEYREAARRIADVFETG